MLSCGALLRKENQDAFFKMTEEEHDIFSNFLSAIEEAVKEVHAFSVQCCSCHSLALAIADSYDGYSTAVRLLKMLDEWLKSSKLQT